MKPHLKFAWQHGGKDVTGSPIEVSQLKYRLYENGELAVDNIGALHFSLDMSERAFGEYQYHVTAVMNGLESEPSNVVRINFTRPAAPHGLTASLDL